MIYAQILKLADEWLRYQLALPAGSSMACCVPPDVAAPIVGGNLVFIVNENDSEQEIQIVASISFHEPHTLAAAWKKFDVLLGFQDECRLRSWCSTVARNDIVEVLMLRPTVPVVPTLSLTSLGIDAAGQCSVYDLESENDILRIVDALPAPAKESWVMRGVGRK